MFRKVLNIHQFILKWAKKNRCHLCFESSCTTGAGPVFGGKGKPMGRGAEQGGYPVGTLNLKQ